MPPAGARQPALAPETPLDDAAVEATWAWKILAQSKSIKGITLSCSSQH